MPLWTWGANSHGQLGLGMSNEQVDTPTVIQNDYLNKVELIKCAGGHSLLLDNEGKLYACGWNLNFQLGFKNNTNKHYFERVWPLTGITFTNIACGWDFSCGVTDDHFFFVWGSNKHGQLGLPKAHFAEVINPIRLQVNACDVSMGLRHTAIINSKGEVWITGCGKYGQLGLGNELLFTDKFQKVLNIDKISNIACGQNHTVAWCSEKNAVFVWGDNKHGQLLLDQKKYRNIFVPQKIDIGLKQGVKKLLSGWTNVLLWLENGELLSWGRNNYGQLGTENETIPGRIAHISLPGGRKVKDVTLGSEHTICLATDNSLWAWGWNEHSNTGIPGEQHIMKPTLVPIRLNINETITNIYTGGAHNFIVTEDTTTGCDNKNIDNHDL